MGLGIGIGISPCFKGFSGAQIGVLRGVIEGTVEVDAALTQIRNLSAQVDAEATVQAAIAVLHKLRGDIVGTTDMTGNVTITGQQAIANSLLLDSSLSQYGSFTPAAGGNAKTTTINMWIKRAELGTLQYLYCCGTAATDYSAIRLNTDNTLEVVDVQSNTVQMRLITTKVLRDAAGWMNINVIINTPESTASDRCKIEINGEQLTDFSLETYPSQNHDTLFNTNIAHAIGAFYSGVETLDTMIAHPTVIDGQALASTNWGEFDATVPTWWKPKAFSGTYGSRDRFYDFSDSADLGADASGNNLDMTTNGGIGASNQTVDVPEDNFCVLNTVSNITDIPVSAGNLKITSAASLDSWIGTFKISEKTYFELTLDSISVFGKVFGIQGGDATTNLDDSLGIQVNYQDGAIYLDGVDTGSDCGGVFSSGSVLGFAVDPDNRKLWVAENGTWRNSGDPAAGTGWVYQWTASDLTGGIFPGGWVGGSNGGTTTYNFGQKGFTYTPPTGFKALSTANIPDTETVEVSGSFTGNANADGPFEFTNGVVTALTINGNLATPSVHADINANGFKLRTASTDYNQSGSNTWTATAVSKFKYSNAQANGVDPNTMLLLHMDGTNGSTTFVDSSTQGVDSPHVMSAGGNAQITTAQKKFGTGSATFDGTGDYVRADNSVDFDYGTDPFTIDFWVRRTTTGTTQPLYSNSNANTTGLLVQGGDDDTVKLWVGNGSSWIINALTTSNTTTQNSWSHVAIVREGTGTNEFKIYIDGTLGAQTTYSGTDIDNNNRCDVGYWQVTGASITGQIDEFRISKGIARWTANFTPPAAPYES